MSSHLFERSTQERALKAQNMDSDSQKYAVKKTVGSVIHNQTPFLMQWYRSECSVSFYKPLICNILFNDNRLYGSFKMTSVELASIFVVIPFNERSVKVCIAVSMRLTGLQFTKSFSVVCSFCTIVTQNFLLFMDVIQIFRNLFSVTVY